MPSGAHPYRRDVTRIVLARTPWPWLLAAFVAFVVSVAALLACAFALVANDNEASGFLYWWRQSILMLIGFELAATQHDSSDTDFQTVQLAGALLRLLIPALLLGAFVFRFMIARNVIVFRRGVGLDTYDGGYALVFRFYSSTALQVEDLHIKLFTEVLEDDGSVRFGTHDLGDEAHVPIAYTHVPHALFAKLDAGDVLDGPVAPDRGAGGPDSSAAAGPRVCRLWGDPVERVRRIVVLIRGSTPQLGTEFVESHEFRQPKTTITAERYGHVDVRWDQPLEGVAYWWSRPSTGWENFERGIEEGAR
jgi:hypothetical protein